MKKLLLASILSICSFLAAAQCYTAPVIGTSGIIVGAATTMWNANPGGAWTVNDTNLAAIDVASGRLTAKTNGTVIVTYNMAGACRLFYSTLAVTLYSGMRFPANICAGLQGTATHAASTSGIWTSSDTTVAAIDSATGLITGKANGRTQITCRFATSGIACRDFDTITISAGIIGRNRLYLADTLTFSDTVTGGAWASSDTNIVAIDTSTGFARAKTLGIAIRTYRVSVGGHNCTATDSLFVTKGIGGPHTICTGDTNYYIDSVAGGSWSSSDTTIAVVDSATGRIYSRALGTATLTYTISSAGVTYNITDTMHVTAATPIAAISPITLCEGDGFPYPATSTPVFFSMSDTSHFVDYPFYRIWYTVPRGLSAPLHAQLRYSALNCSYLRDSTPVTVNPIPAYERISGSGRSICPGDTLEFHATGSSTGTWSVDSDAVVSSTGVLTALPLRHRTFRQVRYMVTNPFGCHSDTYFAVNLNGSADTGIFVGTDTLNIGLIGNYSINYTYPDPTVTDSWSVSPASAATISSTGQLTPLTIGTVVIKHFVTGSCGTDSSSRTITITPPVTGLVSTYFTGYVNRYCSGPQFGANILPHTATYTLKTYYGEGTYDSVTVPPATAVAIVSAYHSYASSGNYTVRQELLNGSSVIDSITYSYMHSDCNNISLSFFEDVDHDCRFSASIDHVNAAAFQVVVDSNGVTVDTIPVTTGMYYAELGGAGTIYSFRVLSAGLALVCPTSGVFYDTIATLSSGVKSFNLAIDCRAASGFDLSQTSSALTGRHGQQLNIHVDNNMCATASGVLSVTFDSHYNFYSASPSPTSVSGSTAYWNLSGISTVTSTHPNINLVLEMPTSGTWFAPGTRVRTRVIITPSGSGDVDTTNNETDRDDTVKSSYDPNMITVYPAGNILNGTKLRYAIEFENDGNDTARNIYVMDTLPDYVRVNTIKLVTASAAMNTSILHSGGHNIIKFDFPHINLADSSHHGHCRGDVVFDVLTGTGYGDGTSFTNHAGIFFDDNPVVLTDTAYNTIIIPSLTVSGTSHDTICHSGVSLFLATPHTVPNTHYAWYVNGTHAGGDSSHLTTSAAVPGDSVSCNMTSVMDDTAHATSNTLHLVERPALNPGTIYGPTAVCVGNSVTLMDSVAGGTWRTRYGLAVATGASMTGVTAGTDTVFYALTNVCGVYATQALITVNPTVYPSVSISATPSSALCEGDSVSLSAASTNGGSSPVYVWEKLGILIGTGRSISYVPSIGDIVICKMAGNADCRSEDTTTNNFTPAVNPAVTPSISIVASPSDIVSIYGDLVSFYPTVTYGGIHAAYQWFVNDSAVPGATNYSFSTIVMPGDRVRCTLTSDAYCISTPTAGSNTVTMQGDKLGVQQGTAGSGGLSIYPNPNSGAFIVSGVLAAGNTGALAIEVRSATGAVVYRSNVMPNGNQIRTSLNLQETLAPGQYFIRITGDNTEAVMHFVVN